MLVSITWLENRSGVGKQVRELDVSHLWARRGSFAVIDEKDNVIVLHPSRRATEALVLGLCVFYSTSTKQILFSRVHDRP